MGTKTLVLSFNRSASDDIRRRAHVDDLFCYITNIDALIHKLLPNSYQLAKMFDISDRKEFDKLLSLTRIKYRRGLQEELMEFLSCDSMAPDPDVALMVKEADSGVWSCFEYRRYKALQLDILGDYIRKNNVGLLCVDESQDCMISLLQMILKVRNLVQLIFVGDKHQTLYRFMYCKPCTDVIQFDMEVELTTTYRFSEKVCEYLRNSQCGPQKVVSSKRYETLIYKASSVEGEAFTSIAHTRIFKNWEDVIHDCDKMMKLGRPVISYSPSVAKRIMDNLNAYKDNKEEKLHRIFQKLTVPRVLEIILELCSEKMGDLVEYTTVHGLKGQERDIVYVSKTCRVQYKKSDHRTTDDECLEYVALTRAKSVLIIED